MGILSLFKRGQADAPPPIARRSAGRPRMPVGRIARAMETAFSAGNAGDRLTSSWPSLPQPADWIVRRHQRILVARSRQQATENDYAKAFLRIVRQNVVGPCGITLVPQTTKGDGNLDAEANKAIAAAWSEWGKRENCDVAGKKPWLQFELSSIQGAAKDGEFMLRKIYGPDAGPWGFALQWLDPQRCPVDYDVERFGAAEAGVFIRHGIEFNRYGRPLAFHFTTADELQADYWYGGKAFVRIPASEIIHGFKDELGGQKRGLPWMATGLYKLRHVGGMEDAAVTNARVGAAKMGFIQWKAGFGPELADGDEGPEIDAEAGVFETLPEGAELADWSPQYPSGEFAPFTKHMLRSIAAGWGVSYNNLANDLEGVNFSSIRQGTLDERERWKEDQEWFAGDLHQQVFAAWLPIALLSGRIRVKGQPLQASRMDRYSAVSWQPRRWTWIDPRSDVDAAVESKNNLLMSPGRIIREQAQDPAEVYREIAHDIEQMKAAGIPHELIVMAFGQKLAPPAAAKPEAAQTKDTTA